MASPALTRRRSKRQSQAPLTNGDAEAKPLTNGDAEHFDLPDKDKQRRIKDEASVSSMIIDPDAVKVLSAKKKEKRLSTGVKKARKSDVDGSPAINSYNGNGLESEAPSSLDSPVAPMSNGHIESFSSASNTPDRKSRRLRVSSTNESDQPMGVRLRKERALAASAVVGSSAQQPQPSTSTSRATAAAGAESDAKAGLATSAAGAKDSVALLLGQALQSADKSKLDSIFSLDNQPAIEATVAQLNSGQIVPLLQQLAVRFKSRKTDVAKLKLVDWLRAVFTYHMSFLTALGPDLRDELAPLKEFVESRAAQARQLASVGGRVQLVNERMKHYQQPQPLTHVPARLVFRDGSSDEEDEGASDPDEKHLSDEDELSSAWWDDARDQEMQSADESDDDDADSDEDDESSAAGDGDSDDDSLGDTTDFARKLGRGAATNPMEEADSDDDGSDATVDEPLVLGGGQMQDDNEGDSDDDEDDD